MQIVAPRRDAIIDVKCLPIRRWHIGRQPIEIGHIGPIVLAEIESGLGEIIVDVRIREIEWGHTDMLTILDDGATRDMHVHITIVRRVQSQLLATENQFAIGAIVGEHGSLNGTA